MERALTTALLHVVLLYLHVIASHWEERASLNRSQGDHFAKTIFPGCCKFLSQLLIFDIEKPKFSPTMAIFCYKI